MEPAENAQRAMSPNHTRYLLMPFMFFLKVSMLFNLRGYLVWFYRIEDCVNARYARHQACPFMTKSNDLSNLTTCNSPPMVISYLNNPRGLNSSHARTLPAHNHSRLM